MKLVVNFFKTVNIKKKVSILILFILCLTSTDLIVKQIALNKLKLQRKSIPQKLQKYVFEEELLTRIHMESDRIKLKTLYKLSENTKNYLLISSATTEDKEFIWQLMSAINFQPEFIILKGPWSWSHYYVVNDDLGFSLTRWVVRLVNLPKNIQPDNFEKRIHNGLDGDLRFDFLKTLYSFNKEKKYYERKTDISIYEKERGLTYLSQAGYKTQKWLILVLLQGLGAVFVIIFYLYNNTWKHLLPLVLIISGALGNLLDRIVRGYVVDYVMWSFEFIPLPLFNPWPIFNLADVYIVIGALLLFAVILFSKENKEL